MNLTLTKKILLLVFIPLTFELAFVGILAQHLKAAQLAAEREYRANQVVTTASRLTSLYYETVFAIWTYTPATRDDSIERYNKALEEIPSVAESLRLLVKDNPREAKIYSHLQGVMEQTNKRLHDLVELVERGSTFQVFVNAARWRDAFRNDVAAFASDLRKLILKSKEIEEQTPARRKQRREQQEKILFAGACLNLGLALFLVLIFARGIINRLQIISTNSKRLAEGKSLEAPLTGSDELAQLDDTFHKMAVALDEAAKKERATIKNAVDVICSIDAEGNFTAVNPASVTVWSYEPSELIGKSHTDLLVAEDVDHTINAVQDLVQSKSAANYENRVRRKDGTIVDMLWSGQWSETEKALYCVAHNLTEKKELERMKADFMAMVSHDLRSPLTSMQASVTLLIEGVMGDISEKARTRLDVLERNLNRMLRMCNDLLALEKLESIGLVMDMKSISVDSLLAGAQQIVEASAHKRNIDLKVEQCDENILADEERLLQVLVNLISNAIKFTPEGSSVIVSVNLTGGWIEFCVDDEGPGVPDEYKEAIFDRFRQVEGMSDKLKRAGTGLGLAICKSMVEAHDGTIGVENRDKKGARFWFRLPRSIEESAD